MAAFRQFHDGTDIVFPEADAQPAIHRAAVIFGHQIQPVQQLVSPAFVLHGELEVGSYGRPVQVIVAPLVVHIGQMYAQFASPFEGEVLGGGHIVSLPMSVTRRASGQTNAIVFFCSPVVPLTTGK